MKQMMAKVVKISVCRGFHRLRNSGKDIEDALEDAEAFSTRPKLIITRTKQKQEKITKASTTVGACCGVC